MNWEEEEKYLLAVYEGFVKCPNTGRILEILPGDTKVLCNCRKSNPDFPGEDAERTGVHFVHFCEKATVREYVEQTRKEFNRRRERK